MTSAKKIAANRNNARKSTGPRNAASKSRVSYNAYRHGLAALKHLEAKLPRDIDLMARALCGDDMNPLLLEQARVIAESQLLLRCVNAERVAMIERMWDASAVPLTKRNDLARARARAREAQLAWEEFEPMRDKFNAKSREERERLCEEYDRDVERLALKPRPPQGRDEVQAMREAFPDLNRLARYERRAWSRRKRALRHFMHIKFMKFEG
jgi:hypothetical protein